MRSKKEREKIKAREEESPPLLFIAFFTSHRSPLSERLEQATFSVRPCEAQKAVSPVKRYSAEALIFTSYSVCIVGFLFTLYTHLKLSCCTRVLTTVVYFFK